MNKRSGNNHTYNYTYKLLYLLIIPSFFLFSSLLSAQKIKRHLDSAQLQALHELNESSPRPDWRVRFTGEGKNPSFLTGGRFQAASSEPVEASREFLNKARQIFRMRDARAEFNASVVRTDKDGVFHVRLDQKVGSLPVFNAQMIVHGDAGGSIWMANGNYYPNSGEIPTPAVSREQAQANASTALNLNGAVAADSCPLGFYPLDDNLYLAYRIVLLPGPSSTGMYEMVCYVDAITGEILRSYNDLKTQGTERTTTGIGYGTKDIERTLNVTASGSNYYLRNISRRQGTSGRMLANQKIEVFDARGQMINSIVKVENLSSIVSIGDSIFRGNAVVRAAVDAFSFLDSVYFYYNSVHGWNSWDDKGTSVFAVVNLGDNDWIYNACWWGDKKSMFFGLGDDSQFYPFSSALDVVAHEFQHAVTDATAALEYYGQSGALNEAYSDIMAAMIDREDWLMGEDLYVRGGYMRNMANPSANGDPDHMSKYIFTSEDQAGVHLNMTIPVKAFYLMSDGGFFEGVSVNGFGREKLEILLFQTLKNYLTPQSNFEDARLAMAEAAKALYPSEPVIAEAVGKAWDAVGVGVQNVALGSPKNLSLQLKDRGIQVSWSPPDRVIIPGSGYSLSGQVRRNDGGDVTGTAVILQKLPYENDPLVVYSNSSGSFSFSDIAKGHYSLFAIKDINGNGKIDQEDWVGFLDSNSDGNPDSMWVDHNITGLSLVMYPWSVLGSSTVSGKVVRIDFGSVAGGVVGLIGQGSAGYEGGNVYSQVLSATGQYKFEGVKADKYILASLVDMDGDNELGNGDYLGFYDPNLDFEPDLIDIPSGMTITNANIILYRINLESTEVEPNDNFFLADPLVFGGVMKASISSPTDIDVFSINVDEPTTIEIDLDAESIGSGLDATMGLFDAEENILAASADEDGKDPRIVYQCPAAGMYYVAVIGVFTTGKYELKLGKNSTAAANLFLPGNLIPEGKGIGRLYSLADNGKVNIKTPWGLAMTKNIMRRGLNSLAPSRMGLVSTVLTDTDRWVLHASYFSTLNSDQTITGYRVYRATLANFETNQSSLVAEVSDTSWIDRNIQNRQRYYYKVTALYSSGESAPSVSSFILAQFSDNSSIAFSDSLLDFGEIPLDSSSRKSIAINNAGTSNLQVSNIISDKRVFVPDITSFTLAPGSSMQVYVVFRPTAKGECNTKLTIYSNDSNTPSKEILLLGKGVERKVYFLGDVNGDQVVNILDALLIMSGIKGMTLPQGVDLSRGDVDGNGRVEEIDANQVLMYVVGLSTPYPIGLPVGSTSGTLLASSTVRNTRNLNGMPQRVVQPRDFSGGHYLEYELVSNNPDKYQGTSTEAGLMEVSWDASRMSFEQLELSTYKVQMASAGEGRLQIAFFNTGARHGDEPLVIRFRNRDVFSSENIIRVGNLESYGSDFEDNLAGSKLDMIANPAELPGKLALLQNTPNPFNPSTEIRFTIPDTDMQIRVSLEIFDIRGRKVKTLLDGAILPGQYSVIWDGRDKQSRTVPSGTYFYRLRGGSSSLTRKMILLK